MQPMRQKAAVENAETEAVISGARSLAPMRQNVKGYENSAFWRCFFMMIACKGYHMRYNPSSRDISGMVATEVKVLSVTPVLAYTASPPNCCAIMTVVVAAGMHIRINGTEITNVSGT